MTGPSALQYDTYYHIFNRGVNKENIFFEECNYPFFLDLMKKHIEPVADLFAFCLLKNHFHLLVRIKAEEEISTEQIVPQTVNQNPSACFSNFFNAYAKAINKAYSRTGSLFQHPFHRAEVTSDPQFIAVVQYIHQNPQKHGFIDDFRNWPYSSYESLTNLKRTWLKRDVVHEWFGGCDAFIRQSEEWAREVKKLVDIQVE
jgi:REP element-mobilizing transposase RayT